MRNENRSKFVLISIAVNELKGELFETVTNHFARTGEDPRWKDGNPSNKEWYLFVQKSFTQLVEVVSWFHDKGICHLDLSLENTMLDTDSKDNQL